MDQFLNRMHGGAQQYQKELLDFSVNINSYGPSENLKSALKETNYWEYPDPQGQRLKSKIANRYNVNNECIHLGNGAAEIFWTLARSFEKERRTALIVEPTFSEFSLALKRHGFSIEEVRATAENRFRLPYQELLARLKGKDPFDFVYICTPNSPTGTWTSEEVVVELASLAPSTVFVIDLAFLQFSNHFDSFQRTFPENVILVHSLTKEHAIPGIRIGFARGAPSIIAQMNSYCSTWNINAFALDAAMIALEDEEFIRFSREKIANDKAYLVECLDVMGVETYHLDCPFILFRWGDPQIQENLIHEGILIRDCSSYQLPGYYRIYPRPKIDVDRLITALKKYKED